MKEAILNRLETGPHGTFGHIYFDSTYFFTGELPWHDNKSNISCIPVGEYTCRWQYSNRFARFMYGVLNVVDRSGVRMHSANFMGDRNIGYKSQLNGCISLGERLGVMDGQKVLLVSAPAIRRFDKLMAGRDFKLKIMESFNGTN